MEHREITNKQFIKDSVLFQKACELAGIPQTGRQAGKWRQNPPRGKANQYRSEALRILAEQEKEKEALPQT